jgi:hypothetical protein
MNVLITPLPYGVQEVENLCVEGGSKETDDEEEAGV